MHVDIVEEVRRQAEICNACRYCESYCSVFPAIHSQRSFSDGDLTQYANLCHNCRACYYACQYTAPHEFDLNLPAALANLRQESWDAFAWPQGFRARFQRSGTAIALAAALAFAFIFAVAQAIRPADGEGFYAVMSHTVMVSIFLPAFILPLVSLGVGLARYWRHVGGTKVRFSELQAAFSSAAAMRNLASGHGEGCNYEDEDRFSQARRIAHQMVMYGFLLCFASTSIATVLHYGFSISAPYGLLSLPKLFGISGGLLLTAGCCWMLYLKFRSDRWLGAVSAWSGEVGFIALLGFVGVSGLVLYVLGETAVSPLLLALHLGAVLAFFLLTPFTKMAHGFYRMAALVRDAQRP